MGRRMDWRSLETMPDQDQELVPFIVRMSCNQVFEVEQTRPDYAAVEVEWFEGRLYPRIMFGGVDYSDGIEMENITHWCWVSRVPIETAPNK